MEQANAADKRADWCFCSDVPLSVLAVMGLMHAGIRYGGYSKKKRRAFARRFPEVVAEVA